MPRSLHRSPRLHRRTRRYWRHRRHFPPLDLSVCPPHRTLPYPRRPLSPPRPTPCPFRKSHRHRHQSRQPRFCPARAPSSKPPPTARRTDRNASARHHRARPSDMRRPRLRSRRMPMIRPHAIAIVHRSTRAICRRRTHRSVRRRPNADDQCCLSLLAMGGTRRQCYPSGSRRFKGRPHDPAL
jgi:hypothetical protein